MRHFLSTEDWSRNELQSILDRARELRSSPMGDALKGKSVALMFFNPSLRTRSSFDIGVHQLGGHAIILDAQGQTWPVEFEEGAVMDGGPEEHVKEAARVLSRYADLIAIRCFPKFQDWEAEREDPLITAYAKHATVPVINMETIVHPCQELAMMLALQDRHGDVSGKDFLLTWVPHPKPLNTAVANSAVLMASKMGMNVRMLIPDEVYELDERYMDAAERFCGENNARFSVTTNVEEAYAGAHAVYAKSWGALPFYGAWEGEAPYRAKGAGFMIDDAKMALTDNATVSHCLPMRRNVKIADSVVDSPAFLGIEEAENRLHVQKAMMERLVQDFGRMTDVKSFPERGGANAPVRSAIVQLLSNMRDGKEIREYLNRFSELDQERFAVVKVGGAIIEDDLDALAAALAFLQSVGLAPIVVHGGGPQLNASLEAAGFPEERKDGLRITPPEAIGTVRDTLTAVNVKLVQAVRDCGGRAAAVPSGVFEAELIDEAGLGRVGEPTGVRLDLVAAAAKAGQAPILTCLGDTADGRLVNINADSAVRALVHKLQPYKVVFLTGTGALLDAGKQPISAINLATDYDDLMASDWVAGGMRLKLQEIKRLLDDLPLSSSVSITRPDQLAKELFTHAGSGTLVRRGERMLELETLDQLDQERTRQLIRHAFGRAPVTSYFDSIAFDHAFVTENYRAAAITTRLDDMIYLDKFAVLDEARGEGLGGAVWRRLIEYAPRLYWRSRTHNPVNEFYFATCDGAVKSGPWTVFWRGEDDLSKLPSRVERIAALPATLEEGGS